MRKYKETIPEKVAFDNDRPEYWEQNKCFYWETVQAVKRGRKLNRYKMYLFLLSSGYNNYIGGPEHAKEIAETFCYPNPKDSTIIRWEEKDCIVWRNLITAENKIYWKPKEEE